MSPARASVAALLTGLVLGVLSPDSSAGQTIAPPIEVETGPDDAFLSHVSGDWIVYSSLRHEPVWERRVCYHHLVDASKRGCLPRPADVEGRWESDVSGATAVFSQSEWIGPDAPVLAGKMEIALFDLANLAGSASEIAPTPTSRRISPSIGGQTVAFIDFEFNAWGDVVLYDRGTFEWTRLTDDVEGIRDLEVGEGGAVVVWTQCQVGTSSCDGWQAVKSPAGGWISSMIPGSSHVAQRVTTDGITVAYVVPQLGAGTANPNHTDICWKPVAGGTVECVVRPGFEWEPTVSGRALVFRTVAALNSDPGDLLLLDMATGAVTNLTNTAAVDELLPSVSTVDRTVRVTWTAWSWTGSTDIYWTQTTLPALVVTPADQLQHLIDVVAADNLRRGIANSLDAKLTNAQAALAAAQSGNSTAACGLLGAFINEVQAQSGRGITADKAAEFIALATTLRTALGCA